MKRIKYLISYDIFESNRLVKVHKRVQAYAITGQKSFYECWLTTQELKALRNELIAIIEPEDKILIWQLDSRKQAIFYGVAKSASTCPFLIV